LLAPLAMLALRGGAYGYVASPSFIRPWLDNLTTQAQVVAHYLRLAVLPFPQSVYHDHPVVAPTSILSWCLLVAYAVLLALALRVLRRAPPLGFGVLGYALFLAPTSSFFPLKETMVEHRTYLPHAFAALAVGWTGAVALTALAARLGRRTPWLHGAIPCALHAVLLCALHVQYGALWQHEETLWVNAVARNGDAVDAHRYLGDLQLEQGRLDDAAASFRRAIAIRPRDGELLSKLGSVLARKGELVEAERLFASALAVSPCHAPALNNLARSLRLRGDTQGAMRRYEEAIRCDADNWLAEKGLGDLYDARGDDRAAAARHYTRALELMDPYHPDAALLKRRIRELTF
jgi:tetratricopeptide (TPR) repeat protein